MFLASAHAIAERAAARARRHLGLPDAWPQRVIADWPGDVRLKQARDDEANRAEQHAPQGARGMTTPGAADDGASGGERTHGGGAAENDCDDVQADLLGEAVIIAQPRATVTAPVEAVVVAGVVAFVAFVLTAIVWGA